MHAVPPTSSILKVHCQPSSGMLNLIIKVINHQIHDQPISTYTIKTHENQQVHSIHTTIKTHENQAGSSTTMVATHPTTVSPRRNTQFPRHLTEPRRSSQATRNASVKPQSKCSSRQCIWSRHGTDRLSSNWCTRWATELELLVYHWGEF